MNRANWPIGYHWSNGWAGRDYVPYAKMLKRAGMNLAGFECYDWFEVQPCDCKKTGGSSRYGGCNAKAHWKDAQRLISTMAARGITTVVTFENRNSCACRQKDDEWRRRKFRKALKLAEFGPIWIIPTSEPWAGSSVEAFVRWARSVTPPSIPFVIPSREKARLVPYYSGLAANYLDIHPCSITEAERALQLGPMALVQTDCTGTLDPGPKNAARLARLSGQTKAGFLIYRFEGDPRPDTIEACGAVIRETAA
jgi:hypothetical protein